MSEEPIVDNKYLKFGEDELIIRLPAMPDWVQDNKNAILIGIGVAVVAGSAYWYYSTPDGEKFINDKISWIKNIGKKGDDTSKSS